MTPTYTPDDISLWRELRYAFDQDTLYKHLCHLSRAFERLWNDTESKRVIQSLARTFLKDHQLGSKILVGYTYMFLRADSDLNTAIDPARSLFIDWNIQRLSNTK